MSKDTNSLTYFVSLTPLQFDTITALTREKYNQLQKLPLKKRNQLNILYGSTYMNDYENALYEILHKFESMRFDE